MDKKQKVLKLAKSKGYIRPKDVEKYGISKQYLYLLYKENKIIKISRGIYSLPEEPDTAHLTLMEAAKKVPAGVFSLISALSFHELTTQLSYVIWMTLPKKTHRQKPSFDYPPLELTYVSEPAFSYGIEKHLIKGVNLQIYSPAKTIADCFKFRNRVGLDVAIEALKDCLKQNKATRDEIYKASKICRVWNIIRPYMEAIE